MNQFHLLYLVNSKQICGRNMSNYTFYQKRGSFQTSLATPEEIKEKYQAIKLHFSTKNYNYFKYNGKVNKQHFKDIVPYTIISKGKYKTDFPDFFIPGLFHNPKVNIDYFLTDDYVKLWKYWKSYQTSPMYFYKEELVEIERYISRKAYKFDKLFLVNDAELPLIYKLIIRHDVSPQTVLYMDQVLQFSKKFKSTVTEKVIYPKLSNRLVKLSHFLRPIESGDLKKITRDVFYS